MCGGMPRAPENQLGSGSHPRRWKGGGAARNEDRNQMMLKAAVSGVVEPKAVADVGHGSLRFILDGLVSGSGGAALSIHGENR